MNVDIDVAFTNDVVNTRAFALTLEYGYKGVLALYPILAGADNSDNEELTQGEMKLLDILKSIPGVKDAAIVDGNLLYIVAEENSSWQEIEVAIRRTIKETLNTQAV